MNSVIQIFKNLAEDDEARKIACNDNIDSGACENVVCDKTCAYKNHESMQRAANVLTNKLGG